MASKYFDKWSVDDIAIEDPGLKRYIWLEPSRVLHGGGRHSRKQFGKAGAPIVERLMNKIMRSGPGVRKLGGKLIRSAKACGKKYKAYNIVRKSF
ncbi:MAG: 30S ribosomal protein S7, partial [Hadesarchaea archaeon]